MGLFAIIQEKIEDLNRNPGWRKFRKRCRRGWKSIRRTFASLLHYRAAFLAVTVIACAIVMAVVSMSLLPAQVGINLLSDGSFSFTMPKLLAVLFPLLITMVSLVFLLISKRTMYPWLVSLFTLAIPVIILVTNVFPY